MKVIKPVLSLRVFQSRNGWRWNMQTSNRRIVAASTESYLERRKAIANFRKVTGLVVLPALTPGTVLVHFYRKDKRTDVV